MKQSTDNQSKPLNRMEPNYKKTINDTVSELREQLTDYIEKMKPDDILRFVNAKIILKKRTDALFQFEYNSFKRNFMDKYHFNGDYKDLGDKSSLNVVYWVSAVPSYFFSNMVKDNLIPEINDDKFQLKFSHLAKLHSLGLLDNQCNAIASKLKRVTDEAKESLEQLVQIRKNYRRPAVHTLDELLNCDNHRIGAKPFNVRMLEDPNEGHWDIDGEEIIDGKTYYGRDPHKDIKDGVVGIDFGTKSTIVYYRSKNNTNEAMPIGGGDDEFDEKRFENPTIMEFVSIENFLKEYNEYGGRPKTNWDDLKISHKAKEDFAMAPGKDFNAYIDNIKQWAAGRNNKLFLVPTGESNKPYKLKPFVEVTDDDINPIEYYAYLIGSFVNRMNQGIYLSYYLSQPVKLESAIKNKIKECFERGIKRSLPDAILDDDDTMKRFYFNADITEPMAYAVCALRTYQLEPDDDNPDPVNYAIFDFGGGTTDFDFGQCLLPDYEDDSSKIVTFGGSGMPYMGGENLLEDLAAKIFIENEEKLVVNGKKFQFQRGPTTEGHEFDPLVDNNSVYASRNMHVMIEELRPYWQESETKLNQNYDDTNEIQLSLVLYDTDGNSYDDGIEFITSKKEIEEFFKNRIREAISNFFVALLTHKEQFEGSDEINIFLAGNSCKSPYVTELFNEKIQQMQGDQDDEDTVNDEESYLKYELYPPLGTIEARKKMEDQGISISNEEFRRMPSGKTGVAYGLLECRKSGEIEIDWVSTRQDTFEFIIGRTQRRLFKPFNTDDGSIKGGKPTINGEWFKAKTVKDGDDLFELKFTKLPEAINGQSPESVAQTAVCVFDAHRGDVPTTLWMKAIGPHSLAYVVQDTQPYDGEELQYKTIELNETR